MNSEQAALLALLGSAGALGSWLVKYLVQKNNEAMDSFIKHLESVSRTCAEERARDARGYDQNTATFTKTTQSFITSIDSLRKALEANTAILTDIKASQHTMLDKVNELARKGGRE